MAVENTKLPESHCKPAGAREILVQVLGPESGEREFKDAVEDAAARLKKAYEGGQAGDCFDATARLRSAFYKDVFVERLWPVLQELYKQLGIQLEAKVGEELRSRGLRFRIEGRVKASESIRETLDAREPRDQPFKDFDQLIMAMHDLLGLRCIVHDDASLSAVDDFVSKTFWSIKPPNDVDPQRPVFPEARPAAMGSYKCRNYRLTLHETMATKSEWSEFRGLIFEIQGTTKVEDITNDALWHPLYKNELGALSEAEVILMDQTNSNLRMAHEGVEYFGKLRRRNLVPFRGLWDFYECLGSAVHDILSLDTTAFKYQWGASALLWNVFSRASINTPLRLNTFLRHLRRQGSGFGNCESWLEIECMLISEVCDLLREELRDEWCGFSGLVGTRAKAWAFLNAVLHLQRWGDMETVNQLKKTFGDEIGTGDQEALEFVVDLFSPDDPSASTAEGRFEDWDAHSRLRATEEKLPNFRTAMALSRLRIVALPALHNFDSTAYYKYPLVFPSYLWRPPLTKATWPFRDEFVVPATHDKQSRTTSWRSRPLLGRHATRAQWKTFVLDADVLRRFLENPVPQEPKAEVTTSTSDGGSTWRSLLHHVRLPRIW